MAVMMRLQFKSQPSTETVALILASASFDPNFEDSDILEDES